LERLPRLLRFGAIVVDLACEELLLRDEAGERPTGFPQWSTYIGSRTPPVYPTVFDRTLEQLSLRRPGPLRFPEAGEEFCGFILFSVLSHSVATRVYLAGDVRLGCKPFVVKLAPYDGREVCWFCGQLGPRVVPAYNVLVDPESGLRATVMPYLPGVALGEVVRHVRRSPMPRTARTLQDVVASSSLAGIPSGTGFAAWDGFPHGGTYAEGAAWVIAELAEAVAEAHCAGLRHGGIRPTKVLLEPHRGPSLLGLLPPASSDTTGRCDVPRHVEAVRWMAPEQLEAVLEPTLRVGICAAADQYALGLLLIHLLTGREPEGLDPGVPAGPALRSVLAGRLRGRPFGPRPLGPEVPPPLGAIAARCLAAPCADRYPDTAALSADLRRWLGGPLVRRICRRLEAFAGRLWC
jgi:serine/threonine protein kinase